MGMKKAIVSGANGFVGSAVTRELASHGVEVIALVREGSDSRVRDIPSVQAVPFDLSDPLSLLDSVKERGFDAFYHFAWEGSAGERRADAGLQLDNAGWTVDCLRLARELGCARFIGAGSIMEQETMLAASSQGGRPGTGYIYGAGKLAAHAMCKSVAADIGIDLIWAMITNAYGPGELSPRMVNTAIRKCLRGEPPQFTSGTQNYDFVYIDDVAKAFRLIGENGRPFYDYRITSSHARPLREFLLEMREAIAPDLDFLFGDVPFTGISLPLSEFDGSLAREHAGFAAEVGFGEGCRRTRDFLARQGGY